MVWFNLMMNAYIWISLLKWFYIQLFNMCCRDKANLAITQGVLISSSFKLPVYFLSIYLLSKTLFLSYTIYDHVLVFLRANLFIFLHLNNDSKNSRCRKIDWQYQLFLLKKYIVFRVQWTVKFTHGFTIDYHPTKIWKFFGESMEH